MCRRPLVLLALLLPLAATGRDNDPVKEKLDKARADYDAQLVRHRVEVGDWLDAQEEAARKGGNKAQVDQLKQERKAFLEDGTLPEGVTALIRPKQSAARTQLEQAYTAVVKEYVKEKKDAEAADVEKQLAEFRKEAWQHLDLSAAAIQDGYVRIQRQSFLRTKNAYPPPVEVVVVARTEKENIRLHAHRNAEVIFNWEVNPKQLRVTRPGGGLATAKVIPLTPNTWHAIRWRLTADGMRVTVDGTVVFTEKKPYDLGIPAQVAVQSVKSLVDVKEFYVVPLKDK